MAQVLKDDVRNAIIEAAKQEFLKKGYKAASMRTIAKNANMTVGNLYRYFKNKEEINLYIVGPTFKKIDNSIKVLSSISINKVASVFEAKTDMDELSKSFEVFANDLVNIYKNNKIEFNILIMHSRLDEELSNSFSFVFDRLLAQHFLLAGLSNDKTILSNAYGKAMFEGMKSIFSNVDNDYKTIRDLLITYFKSFIYLANDDFNIVFKKI